jgi:FkbH-like protein
VTVTEALKVLQRAPKECPRFQTFLACGFTPLHLQLFLTARLQQRLQDRTVEIKTGIYGNLAVTLEDLSGSDVEGDVDAAACAAVACAMEWPDLDARFSYRESGSWGVASVTDIVNAARKNLDRIRAAMAKIPRGVRVAVALPTLPLPPLFHTVTWQASRAELLLEEMLAEFALRVADRRGTVVVNARRLDGESPIGERLDLKSDLATGLPYTRTHADKLALTFAQLLVPNPPKKGLITDLDDTLWYGIVGELGADGVAWDLPSHHQIHGLYQKLLSSLSEAGTLIAIASKNDLSVVEETFKRQDLLIRPSQIFPVEVHWEAKSGSVDRILKTWNISADSVIFVDDSPMELAEVEAAHPGITCIRFPTGQPEVVPGFLRSLRDLCGKENVSDDDALRLESIRRGAEFKRESAAVATPDDFLRAANATVAVSLNAGPEDARALELVNKTNQFNINGARYTDAEWRKKLAHPKSFLLVVSYSDKFGPLGKVGVIQGIRDGSVLRIETWVMSCRAFARRIEHQCLRLLFDRVGIDEIEIRFASTAKNKPVQEFLASLSGKVSNGVVRLSRIEATEKCPPLYHLVSLVGEWPDSAIDRVESIVERTVENTVEKNG